jgi:hypothetical protein
MDVFLRVMFRLMRCRHLIAHTRIRSKFGILLNSLNETSVLMMILAFIMSRATLLLLIVLLIARMCVQRAKTSTVLERIGLTLGEHIK